MDNAALVRDRGIRDPTAYDCDDDHGQRDPSLAHHALLPRVTLPVSPTAATHRCERQSWIGEVRLPDDDSTLGLTAH